MHDDLIANWEPDGSELRLRPLGVLLLEPPVWPHVPWQQPCRPAVWLWFLSFLSLLFLPVAQPQIKTHSNFPVVAPLSAVLNFLHA